MAHISREETEIEEMIDVIACGFDGTVESQKGILKTIIYLANESRHGEEEWGDVIHAANRLAQKGVLDGRDVIEQLVVPLAYGIEDPKLLLDVTTYIAHSVGAFDDGGHILGASKLDRINFETLAMLFGKLSRIKSSKGRKQTYASQARSVADTLYGLLILKDENDPEIIALIKPFTSLHAAAAQHKHAANAAPAYRIQN